jgi:hypothetical protein
MAWGNEKMHMVRHEAIRVYSTTEPRCIGTQSNQVGDVIIVVKEAGCATVRALDYMERNVWNDEARDPRHSS